MLTLPFHWRFMSPRRASRVNHGWILQPFFLLENFAAWFGASVARSRSRHCVPDAFSSGCEATYREVCPQCPCGVHAHHLPSGFSPFSLLSPFLFIILLSSPVRCCFWHMPGFHAIAKRGWNSLADSPPQAPNQGQSCPSHLHVVVCPAPPRFVLLPVSTSSSPPSRLHVVVSRPPSSSPSPLPVSVFPFPGTLSGPPVRAPDPPYATSPTLVLRGRGGRVATIWGLLRRGENTTGQTRRHATRPEDQTVGGASFVENSGAPGGEK